MLFAFIDTNTLLHYPPLKLGDWKKVCGTDAVTVMICRPVVEELDDKKSDARYSERARKRIKEIEENIGTEIVPGVRLDHDPETDTPATLPMDKWIAECVLEFEKKGSADVAVVTEDLGMKLRCRQLGIRRIDPPDNCRLENPASEEQKRIKKLEQELRDITGALPDLRVTIEPLTHELKRPGQFDIPKFMDEAKERLLRDYHEFARRPDLFDPYLGKVREWLEKNNEIANESARTVKVGIALHNEGKAPAEKVDLEIKFPDQITAIWFANSVWGKRVQKPEWPQGYKFRLSPPEGFAPFPNENAFYRTSRLGKVTDRTFFADFEVVRQDETITFEPFYLTLGTWDDVGKIVANVYIRTQRPPKTQPFDIPIDVILPPDLSGSK